MMTSANNTHTEENGNNNNNNNNKSENNNKAAEESHGGKPSVKNRSPSVVKFRDNNNNKAGDNVDSERSGFSSSEFFGGLDASDGDDDSKRYFRNDASGSVMMDDTSRMNSFRRMHSEDTCVGKFRNGCGRFVNNKWIQIFISILIISNGIILGLDTYPVIQENHAVHHALGIVDLICLIIFTIEITLQLIYHGPVKIICSFGWECFDLFIVIMSWCFLGTTLSVLRSLRVLRLFALISRWSSLRILITAIGRTIPNMASIWAILAVFFYVFTVLFTSLYQDLYKDGYLDEDYFGSLQLTCLTLFQFMTLDSWTSVVRQVMETKKFSPIGLIAWVIITSFFMLNLLIAVVCETLRELSEMQEKRRQRKLMRQQNKLFSDQKDALISEQEHIIKLQQLQLQQQQETHAAILEILQAVAPQSQYLIEKRVKDQQQREQQQQREREQQQQQREREREQQQKRRQSRERSPIRMVSSKGSLLMMKSLETLKGTFTNSTNTTNTNSNNDILATKPPWSSSSSSSDDESEEEEESQQQQQQQEQPQQEQQEEEEEQPQQQEGEEQQQQQEQQESQQQKEKPRRQRQQPKRSISLN